MNEPKNKKSIETGSGILWTDWLEILAPHKDLDHASMAKLVNGEIVKVGKSKSSEWWAQAVTIAYERHIGRRQIGQTCDGNFSVTVSKTMLGDMDTALATWLELVSDRAEFDDVPIKGQPRISETEKWRYWRCDLEDGSKLSVNIQTKSPGDKSALAINHDKLSVAEDVDRWRTYWSAKLKQNML